MNKYAQRVRELGGRFVFRLSGEAPVILSEEDIISVEQKLKHQLPDDYREFLREFGGYSFSAIYPIKSGMPYLTSGSLGVMFGLKMQLSNSYDLLQLYNESLEDGFIAPELLPIAEDNANRVCLFLEGPKHGQIHYWNWEDSNLYFIANNFGEFIDICYRVDD